MNFYDLYMSKSRYEKMLDYIVIHEQEMISYMEKLPIGHKKVRGLIAIILDVYNLFGHEFMIDYSSLYDWILN